MKVNGTAVSLVHDLDAGHFEYIGVDWFTSGDLPDAKGLNLDNLGLLIENRE